MKSYSQKLSLEKIFWQTIVCLGLTFSLAVHGDAFQQDVPEGLAAGFGQITEQRVTQTIAFLASDEMAGRGTPSKEFTIATAYVAARFQGAGLKGGGVDASFYQEQLMREIRTPTDGLIAQDQNGADLQHYGLLSAEAALEFQGSPTSIDLNQDHANAKWDGIVTGVWQSEANGQRSISQIVRICNSLRAAGAKALLLQVREDSPLIALAAQRRERPQIESARGRFNLPVLLVKEGTVPESVRLKLPPLVVSELPMRNVIGVLEGSDPELKREAIVFSAHLDHLGARPGSGDGIFNGADDDASGCTAVLTLADAFTSLPQRPKRTLIFMTFWGEESGLLGSRQFAEQPTWPLDKIVANVNIEMIGRPESGATEKIWMTGWDQSDLGTLMNVESQRIGVEIFEHPKFSAMLYRASDNWSLAEKGVIAHSFSAGSLHADYHQPDDEWDRLNIPHMTRVIQGLFAGSQALSNGSAKPLKAK